MFTQFKMNDKEEYTMFKKFQLVTQFVGIVTLMLLAVYGLMGLLFGGDSVLAASLNNLLSAPAIPATFNYQGTLRDASGNLITGTATIDAKIYDLPAGGSVLYQETFPNVTVRDGAFNIVLGDNPGAQNLLAQFSATPRYIGITLNSGTELIPRQRLHGVPWALYATTASRANDFIVSGKIGIGTEAPETELDVRGSKIQLKETSTGDALTFGTWGSELDINYNKNLWFVGSDNTQNIYLNPHGGRVGIGTYSPSTTLDVKGDIHWDRASGHLTGFALSNEYYKETADGFNDAFQTLVPTANSMCFLTRVESLSVDDGEWANCQIYVDGSNNFILKASARSDGLYNAQAKCSAMCLQW
jgi:hypothetical protein